MRKKLLVVMLAISMIGVFVFTACAASGFGEFLNGPLKLKAANELRIYSTVSSNYQVVRTGSYVITNAMWSGDKLSVYVMDKSNGKTYLRLYKDHDSYKVIQ